MPLDEISELNDPVDIGHSPGNVSRHSRSRSHPFLSALTPSLLNRHETVGEGDPAAALSSSGRDNALPLNWKDRSHPSRHVCHEQELDFTYGCCATCASRVRWPKHLGAFRCSICSMVNTVPSAELTGKPGGNDEKYLRQDHLMKDPPSEELILTLHQTLEVIEKCVESLLYNQLETHTRKEPASVSESKSASIDETPPLSKGSRSAHQEQTGAILAPRSSSDIYPKDEPHGKGKASVVNRSGIANEAAKHPLGQLESYLITCFSNASILNASFHANADFKEFTLNQRRHSPTSSKNDNTYKHTNAMTGSVESGEGPPAPTWKVNDIRRWPDIPSGSRGTPIVEAQPKRDGKRVEVRDAPSSINLDEVDAFYDLILSLPAIVEDKLRRSQVRYAKDAAGANRSLDFTQLQVHHGAIDQACHSVQIALLKASENCLRNPRRALKTLSDIKFIVLILLNPLLSEKSSIRKAKNSSTQHSSKSVLSSSYSSGPATSASRRHQLPKPNTNVLQHSSILKRAFGLLSNLHKELQQAFIGLTSYYPNSRLRRMIELVNIFVSYRIERKNHQRRSNSHDITGIGLIPELSASGTNAPAQLHAAIGKPSPSNMKGHYERHPFYYDDWQLVAAAKVMSLLFTANGYSLGKREKDHQSQLPELTHHLDSPRIARTSPLIPLNVFYNSSLDYSDLVSDFESWESRRGKFSFCQYPMFLSIWAKTRIMEYDARRQMELKAREAFFDSITSRKVVSQYLLLKIRRDCLVEDSLRGVSEVVGSGQEEIKKGLRIEFLGEEGLDSGGLRKEWFLLLVREVFDPEHGLFVYDDDSKLCYFNPHTYETSDQFFLVGVLLGLAIYNSTILDVALPSFAFRKLLAAAPMYSGPAGVISRSHFNHSLQDLAEYSPALALGLHRLLEFEGDNVEQIFCLNFVVVTEKYGHMQRVPLCVDGENRSVTNGNRKEYVALYVRYILDGAVSRQFEPFKRGFFTVCGGNALSLFRAEEIELLIRGSDEPLDVSTLKAVALYEGWAARGAAPSEGAVSWFWDAFAEADPKNQRRLLSFITASDRIPAMGASSLVIKITCLGNDDRRYPIARTCFNMIGLYRYSSRKELEEKLWRAVAESEGFGLR